ncbi:hypothetical protein [Synechococcus sp. PCC 6312]|uniref:hypothetical protein n=1 Tax=Synechococcus sp. (strain ATCC 27167 / PCC 6312) TaxID=195253 RepID=UPI00029ED943|nr:hypothetical protein [Synechococcus sp. PCC 6312]AFY59880.1 hypothetical protein Syn6312_0660 [Synechococcus sp. PCC 6312]
MGIKPLNSLLTIGAVVGFIGVGDLVLQTAVPQWQSVAVAAPAQTPAEQITLIVKSKGQVGSGDQLRRFFFGDLLPLGVQPGGAGMVVNLYNKANDVTFSYCATYDVIVAVKKGKITMFDPSEVK